MARLKGFEKLTSVDEALRIYFETVKPKRLGAVMVPLREALNRVVAQDIIAEKDLPSFNRSAVDGYAVKATDTANATQFNPKTLQITSKETIRKGEAKTIWTGKPLPNGADAVVMLEHVKRLDHKIKVETQVTPGENVSKKGEDVQKGQVAVKDGTRLKPQHLGLLAALEYSLISVVEKPRIAILVTGNELVELGKKPKRNQIIDTNHLVLSTMCQELGAEPVNLGISKDDENEIGSKIKQGLEKAHMVLTTGGTSTGESDLVPWVISKLGEPGIIVHGIAMRPGMPTALALVNAKPVVVLSGNPVAAMIGFEVFVRPMVLSMLGVKNEQRHLVKAKLIRRVAGALGRKVFLRVLITFKNDEFFAEPIRVTGSGMLSTLTKANGYVVIPENREGLEEGEMILVHLFDSVKMEE